MLDRSRMFAQSIEGLRHGAEQQHDHARNGAPHQKIERLDSSLLGVGCDESQEVLMGVGKHGEQGADGIPAPLTPALAWRSSRIPAEPYPPASNSIVSGMTLAVKR